MGRPRVVLAENHPFVAEMLKQLVADEFDLVGAVEDGLALVDAAQTLVPDVVVADVSMPGLDGLDALAEIKRRQPSMRVVLVTMHRDAVLARHALEMGASGFVLKAYAPVELGDAIRAALSGGTYVSSALTL